MLGKREQMSALLGEALGDRPSSVIALPLGLTIEAPEHLSTDRLEVRSARDRDKVLPANRAPPALDAALVMPRTGASEAWLEGVVRRQRLHPPGELSLRAHQDAYDRGPQIVVEQAM